MKTIRSIQDRGLKVVLAVNQSPSSQVEELSQLALSAGMSVLGVVRQKRKALRHNTYFSSGKVQELKNMILETEADGVLFNNSLTGSQTRNLQSILQVLVLERSQLILKIFSDRAKSQAGRLQVELAQKLDEWTRAKGAWLGSLSRQGGGKASARGPGEKALETDRRQIQKRITVLRKRIKLLRKNRSQQRKLRQKNEVPSFALIGYTNSGKSSLLNRLSRVQAGSGDQPFLTLDPLTRKVFIPGLHSSVLTDTVGFIKNLPTHLISAFKATLEESSFADVLLHVIDLSHPAKKEHIHTVEDLIHEFGWSHKPILYVYNKIDQARPEDLISVAKHRFCVHVSALSGEGLPALLEEMRRAYLSLNQHVEMFFPQNEQHKIELLCQEALVHSVTPSAGGSLLKAKMPTRSIDQWKSFITQEISF